MRAWLAAREDMDAERLLVGVGDYAEGTLNLLIQAWVHAPTVEAETRARTEIVLRIEDLRTACDLLKPGF